MSAEVAEFWLTAPRYLQQVGEPEPKYVAATPTHPVRVKLPSKIKRNGAEVDLPDDGHLKRIKASEAAPKPPVDVRPKLERQAPKSAPEMVKEKK